MESTRASTSRPGLSVQARQPGARAGRALRLHLPARIDQLRDRSRLLVYEGEAMISKHRRLRAEPLSARIFRLRIAQGYSIYELAKAANVFAGTLQRLESGKPVDKSIMPALAVALDVSLCHLVCGEHSCSERACVLRDRLLKGSPSRLAHGARRRGNLVRSASHQSPDPL
jgi:transcriptional regulator with XRE-family HTH domain